MYEESRTGGRMTATVTAELRPPSGGNPEPGGLRWCRPKDCDGRAAGGYLGTVLLYMFLL